MCKHIVSFYVTQQRASLHGRTGFGGGQKAKIEIETHLVIFISPVLHIGSSKSFGSRPGFPPRRLFSSPGGVPLSAARGRYVHTKPGHQLRNWEESESLRGGLVSSALEDRVLAKCPSGFSSIQAMEKPRSRRAGGLHD